MSADSLSLDARSLALREQLQLQRAEVALQLAPEAGDRYPRSATMRLLLSQPELMLRLVTRLAGARFAGPLYAVLLAIQALDSFAGITPRRPSATRAS